MIWIQVGYLSVQHRLLLGQAQARGLTRHFAAMACRFVSKVTDQQVVMLGQQVSNPNIHKVQVSLNAYNQFEEFEFDTADLPLQDGVLSFGEKINFMAFATNNNNSFSKTDVFPFVNEANTGIEPSIVLENVDKKSVPFSSLVLKFSCPGTDSSNVTTTSLISSSEHGRNVTS